MEMRRQCHNVRFFYVKNHEVSKLPLLLFEMFAFSKPNNTFNFGFPKELLVGALGLQVETCSILAMVV